MDLVEEVRQHGRYLLAVAEREPLPQIGKRPAPRATLLDQLDEAMLLVKGLGTQRKQRSEPDRQRNRRLVYVFDRLISGRHDRPAVRHEPTRCADRLTKRRRSSETDPIPSDAA